PVLLERVHGAVLRVSQPPGAAEVNHPQSATERLRHPLARDLMRSGEKEKLDLPLLQQLPGERKEREHAAVERRSKLSCAFALAREQQGGAHTRMPQQEPRELRAGIAGCADDRRLQKRAPLPEAGEYLCIT